MPHFKDDKNTVYWLDAGDSPAVWLPHCTPISDAEADALRAAAAPQIDPRDAIRAEIAQLERDALMPRATREFMLMQMQADAQAFAAANGVTADAVLSANPGYQAVYAFDMRVKALRDQL